MGNDIHSKYILGQLDKAKKAMPSEEFLSRMEKMADAYTKISDKVSMRTVYMLAASFLLLVAANFLIMNDHLVQDSLQETTTESASNYTMVPAKSIYND